MKTYLLKPGVRQAIAKAGETGIAVAYNAKAWLDDYPAGIPQLMVTRPDGVRVPVTVAKEDNLIAGMVPNELLVNPGMYSYVFVWVSGATQLESGRCECMVLGSDLAKSWADVRRAPDWAERIFLAAGVIESAVNGAMEARNTAVDMAEEAETHKTAAEAAQEAAEDAQEAAETAQAAAEAVRDSIPQDYTALSNTVVDLKSAVDLSNNELSEVLEDTSTNLFWMFPEQMSNNGITCAYDKDTGEITLNGTATANALFPIRGIGKGVGAGTYIGVLSDAGGTISTASAFSVRYGDFSSGIGTRWLNNSNQNVTITLSASDEVALCITSGTTVTNKKYLIKINNGTAGQYFPGWFTAVDTKARQSISNVSEILGEGSNYYTIPNLNGYTISGKAYNTSGAIVDNAATYTTDIFRLLGHSIVSSAAVTGYATFNANMQFIERIINSQQTYTFDNDVKYIAIMYSNMSQAEINSITVDGIVYERETTILVDGTNAGYIEAVTRAKNFLHKEKVTVNIMPGEYDVYEELGGDTYLATIGTAGWSNAQPIFTIPAVINGIGDVTLKLVIPQDSYSSYQAQAQKLSIVNCRNSIEVNNIRFVAARCRYAIHDECDNSEAYAGSSHVYRNCRMELTNAMSGIGIGSSTGTYLVDNCYIVDTVGDDCVFLHNWSTNKGGSLVVRNCALKCNGGNKRGVRLQNNSDADYVFDVAIQNCYFNDTVLRLEKTGNYTTNYFRIVVQNCNIDSLSYDDGITTDNYPVEFYNW